eukprot:1027861-Amphidinium_carterae.1
MSRPSCHKLCGGGSELSFRHRIIWPCRGLPPLWSLRQPVVMVPLIFEAFLEIITLASDPTLLVCSASVSHDRARTSMSNAQYGTPVKKMSPCTANVHSSISVVRIGFPRHTSPTKKGLHQCGSALTAM